MKVEIQEKKIHFIVELTNTGSGIGETAEFPSQIEKICLLKPGEFYHSIGWEDHELDYIICKDCNQLNPIMVIKPLSKEKREKKIKSIQNTMKKLQEENTIYPLFTPDKKTEFRLSKDEAIEFAKNYMKVRETDGNDDPSDPLRPWKIATEYILLDIIPYLYWEALD